MQARELMVPPVAVRATDSLARAATMMRDRGCGSVVVLQHGDRAVAMLTDRDTCMAALTEVAEPDKEPGNPEP